MPHTSELSAGTNAVAGAERDGFDAVRVGVDGALADVLLHGADDETTVTAARTALAALAAEHVDRGPGVLVLTGLPDDEAAGSVTISRVSSMLGDLLPQDRHGTLVREVRDRGGAVTEPGTGRYSDFRFGGDLHTDAALDPLPAPDLFLLLCIRQSVEGGALELVHLRDIYRALASRPDVIETLKAPFHFDRRGQQQPDEAPTTEKPILFEQNGRQGITYLRSYVDHGHDHDGVPPLSDRQREALEALDGVLTSGSDMLTGRLRDGELAIFDNLAVLHGRTTFADTAERKRLLLRTWVQREAVPT